MTKAELYKKAEQYVLAHVLSDWEGTWNNVMEDLENEDWKSVIPWQPFEEYTGDELGDLLIEWREDLVKLFWELAE